MKNVDCTNVRDRHMEKSITHHNVVEDNKACHNEQLLRGTFCRLSSHTTIEDNSLLSGVHFE